MRTTITLDADVASRVKQEMRRTNAGLKAVINRALRLGLGLGGKPPSGRRFTVKAHAFGFAPGIDLDRLNQLADELEVTAARRKLQE